MERTINKLNFADDSTLKVLNFNFAFRSTVFKVTHLQLH